MLGIQKLIFPRLTPLNQEALFERNPPKQRIWMYKLNWNLLKQKHPGKHTLPDPWGTIFASELFAIPTPYLREIKHHAKCAQLAWDREVHALPNTLQRFSQAPAGAHVLAAFAILADCLYDPETKNWCRIWLKYGTATVLALKFWYGHAQSSMDALDLSQIMHWERDMENAVLDLTKSDQIELMLKEITTYVMDNPYNLRIAKEFDLKKAEAALQDAGLGRVTSYEDILKLECLRDSQNVEHVATATGMRDPDDPIVQQLVDDAENLAGGALDEIEVDPADLPDPFKHPTHSHSLLPGDG